MVEKRQGVKEGARRILTGFLMTRKASHAEVNEEVVGQSTGGEHERDPRSQMHGALHTRPQGAGFVLRAEEVTGRPGRGK